MWLVVYVFILGVFTSLCFYQLTGPCFMPLNLLFNCWVSLTQFVPSNKKMMATFGKISSRAWINDSGTSHSRRTPYPLLCCHIRPITPATHTDWHIKPSSIMSSTCKHTKHMRCLCSPSPQRRARRHSCTLGRGAGWSHSGPTRTTQLMPDHNIHMTCVTYPEDTPPVWLDWQDNIIYSSLI